MHQLQALFLSMAVLTIALPQASPADTPQSIVLGAAPIIEPSPIATPAAVATSIVISPAASTNTLPRANVPDVIQAAPGPINITEVQTSGAGCGRNQARLEDSTIVLGPLPKFEASWQDQTRRQVSCLVMAQVTYPVGTQFAVLPGVVYGKAQLDPGVTARFLYSHHYQQEAQLSHNYAQELPNGPFSIAADSLHSNTFWSHCGGNDIVSVNFRLATTGDTQSTATGVVSAFGTAPLPITLAWRSCTA